MKVTAIDDYSARYCPEVFDIIYHDGVRYQCALRKNGCDNCDVNHKKIKEIPARLCKSLVCSKEERPDKTDVLFKRMPDAFKLSEHLKEKPKSRKRR